MARKPQIIEDMAERFPGISLINLCSFGHDFWTRNARKSIKGSKDSYYSLEPKKLWATKSARLFDSQGLMTSTKCKQIYINILSLCKNQQKTQHLKLKNFFAV